MMFWMLFGSVGYLVLTGKLKYENAPINPTAVQSQDLGNAQPSQKYRIVSGAYDRADNANQPWNSYTSPIMRGKVTDTVEYDTLDQPTNSQIMNDLSTIWTNLTDSFGGNDAKYRLESRDSLPNMDRAAPSDSDFSNSIVPRW